MIGYLVLVNLVSFVMYGIDKRKAIKDQWRIPEKTLLLAALVGGSLGAFVGMQIFHHKTKHWNFKTFFPLMLIVQLVLLGFIIVKWIA